ncbi:hypothetical protein FOA43_002513 [Brettanomyces nanus]|uniref:Phosphatidyl-N-methylethanolamine N-methyltransferase n=1 Tax=Eeniella nana TaxID=13502 RepID=A0A875S1B2_EENNA|nr:uncharacterized protein FOA43_002513 [Brettanomyces nanus]QPG75166.1 hypothetical protein FOA43_002513 [Brettanomyces nanus]
MEAVQKLSDLITGFLGHIDFNNKAFQKAIFFIIFNPLYWNFGARLEHKTKFLSKLAFGSKKSAVYIFSATVFSLGIMRDNIYRDAILEQATSPFLDTPFFKGLGIACFGFGSVLVASSMYKLGIVGTYLGDHFGFLKNERITDFPFNLVDNPMYDGSSLSFLGAALFFAKPAGLWASGLVYAMYRIVELIEEPFTAKIYAERSSEKKAA